MKTDYSTAEGQKQLMRESVGQPAHFPRPLAASGFHEGEVLMSRDVSQRHPSNHVTYLRDVKPENGLTVIVVQHRNGVTGEWLARDWQLASR